MFRSIVTALVVGGTFVFPAEGKKKPEKEAAEQNDGDSRELKIAETMLLHQRRNGGWPKNYDRGGNLSRRDRKKLIDQKSRNDTTFDNGATWSEMRHLARVYEKTSDDRYRRSFLRGLDFVLKAQYGNGGWPQFYPEARGYHAHITFNDDAMTGVMELLTEIGEGAAPYAFVDKRRRQRCIKAVGKGIRCILKCQITVNGRKTAWCAQHDRKSLAPRKARSYELRSISGSESVGIVRYLMKIDRPSPDVIRAVKGAVSWFEKVKITGINVEKKKDASAPRGYDKVVVKDPGASPLWARFYTIGSNRPIFCSRDGIPRDTLAEISYERRNGYSWYTRRPLKLLTVAYPKWKKRMGL